MSSNLNIVDQPSAAGDTAATRAKTLRELVAERDRLTAETGHYCGVTKFRLKDEDPLRYERFYSRIHSTVLAAREVARYVAASPGGREMGESLWALTTPEGDSLAISLGFFSHIASFPVAIRHMADEGFDDNPGINDADVFSTDDGLTGGAPHPGDTYTYVPMVIDGEIIGWAVGLNHIMEAGAPVAGSWPGFCVDTFMDGFVFPPMKTGENLKQATWWNNLWKRRTRAGALNILDDKMRLAGCAMIHQGITEIIEEFGIEYYKRATREVIEESRRVVLDNIRNTIVPGRYDGAAFRVAAYKDLQNIWSYANKDNLIHVRSSLEVDEQGRIVVDTEGSSRWGYHAFNGYPGGADCALFLGMINSFAHNTKVTSAINLAVKGHYAKGSIYNPDSDFASFANIWAQSMAMNSLSYNSVNRSMFARGYIEEAFATDGDWEGIQGSGELADGTPYGFTNFENVGGVARGAFAYRDGQPVCYAQWTQLCNIGNAEEFEYLIPSLFYLGRKTLPGFCGHGKYRGGLGQTSVHWVVEPGKRLGVSRGGAGTSQTAFQAHGASGAYPAPGAFAITARGTNVGDIIEHGGETPRDAMEIVTMHESGHLSADELAVWKCDVPELAMEANDLLAEGSGSSSGWGDPLERAVDAVIEDLNLGAVPYEFSLDMYGVVATENEQGVWVADTAVTTAKREALRKARLAESVPAREWWARNREIVTGRDLIEPVIDMLRSSTSFDKFNREFRGFWQLPDSFEL